MLRLSRERAPELVEGRGDDTPPDLAIPTMSDFDFDRFDALTFDCYGTLIDWERGILNALQPVLAPRASIPSEDELLELYAQHEAELEAGPYLAYREVVAGSLRAARGRPRPRGVDEETAAFAAAVGDWPAFPDTAARCGTCRTASGWA